jgi:hypothetical protein
MPGDAVSTWPFAFGQMVSAEQSVKQGEVDREIHINRLGIDAMMPVVKPGRDNEFSDAVELPADVGVNESRTSQRIGIYRGSDAADIR